MGLEEFFGVVGVCLCGFQQELGVFSVFLGFRVHAASNVFLIFQCR